MISLHLDRDQYLEFEKIGLGAFFPLCGFMTEIEFISVAETLRLPSSEVFSLPVVLDIDENVYRQIKNEKKIKLIFLGVHVGFLFPNDFYRCNRVDVANKIFGTHDEHHPGVKYFYSLKPVFVGGGVELIRRTQFEFSENEMTPSETKSIFNQLGWKRIVGFQTRNVPHRAHEYLLRIALEWSDGIFVQPLIGRKQSGDFTPNSIMMGYRALIENYLPPSRVILGVLSTVMRYAGPREAIFHAIIRRNYGCSHFIVGRDHAGVGDWYGLYDAHELTRQFEGDLGIEILRLKGPYHCKKCDGIATENTCPHTGTGDIEHISGTYMRSILREGGFPKPHLMRQEVINSVKDVDLFIE